MSIEKITVWQKVMLRDLCSNIQYGYTEKASSVPVGPKFLRITDIVPDTINWEKVPYCAIPDEKYELYSLKQGDIVIARTGATTGYAKCLKNIPRSVFASYLVRLQVTKEVEPRYIGFIVESKDYKNFIKKNIGGSAQPNANAQILTSYILNLPNRSTQRKIASILSAYDDLIENNLRRIKILEEMAQNLYREWFFNFRFPGHEHARFVDSPLGRIPEGWEIHKLGDFVTLDKGISYQGKYLTSDGSPMVNLKCIKPGGGFNRGGTKPYAGDYKLRHTLQSGDLVFANTDLTQAGNIIGRPAIVPKSGFYEGGIASHHICIVRVSPRSPLSVAFLFHLLESGGFSEFAKGCASGTTVLGLRANDALKFEFPLPPSSVVQRFEMLASDIYALNERLFDKNDTLRQTRDLLLPKLISGEVEVSDLDIYLPEEALA